MYCKYFSREYLSWGNSNRPGSHSYADEPDHIFDRSDVRLVLDLGASTGGLALSLYRHYGDRIVTVSATLIVASEAGAFQSHPPPFLQTISARGFPTVALDLYSYFPFAESTFDVLWTSWAYTSGFTRQSILEMYRVVRPGGFVVAVVWDKAAGKQGSASDRATHMATHAAQIPRSQSEQRSVHRSHGCAACARDQARSFWRRWPIR